MIRYLESVLNRPFKKHIAVGPGNVKVPTMLTFRIEEVGFGERKVVVCMQVSEYINKCAAQYGLHMTKAYRTVNT